MTMKASLAFVLLFITLAAFGSWTEVVYTGTLRGSQVVPDTGAFSYSDGIAVCSLQRYLTPPILDCEVQHNVTSPTSIRIAQGARGVNGATVFEFSGILGRNVRQKFSFENDVDAQVDAFLRGQFYIIIGNEVYPEGEIRAQLEAGSRVFARLNSLNTIPLASGSTATGLATGTYSFNNPNKLMSFSVVHNVDNPRGFKLNEGASNQIGSVSHSFPTYTSPIFTTIQLSSSEERLLWNDLMYLSVTSQANPTGDIRGQLIDIDYLDEGSFTAFLTGAAVNNPVDTQQVGCAIVSFDCKTKVMEYIVVHNIPDASAGGILLGTAADQGTILFNLPSGTAPIYGREQLNNAEISELYAGNMFFQIYRGAGPYLRGAINTEFDFFSYLTGSTELPGVSTPAKGCGLFHLRQGNNETVDELRYVVTHTVEKPIAGRMHVGLEGTSGPTRFEVPSVIVEVDGTTQYSPWAGQIVALSNTDLKNLVDEKNYFEIQTNEHLQGEIRGQIRRINPCVPTDIELDIPDGTSVGNVFTYFGTMQSEFSGQLNIKYFSDANSIVVCITLIIACVAAVLL